MMKAPIFSSLFILVLLSGCKVLNTPLYSEEMRNHFMHNVRNELLIDQTEVTVKNWLEFMFFSELKEFPGFIETKGFSTEEIDKLLSMSIDHSLLPVEPTMKSFIIDLINMESEELVAVKLKPDMGGDFYLPVPMDSLNSKQYKERIRRLLDIPVTGISYEQAIRYCAWRTELDSIRMYDLSYKLKGLSLFENFKYELPSPELYDELLSQVDSVKDDLQHSTFNYLGALPPFKDYVKYSMGQYGEELVRIAATPSFSESSKRIMKLYDLHGNAAEMTNVKGIAKGGSYTHYAYESYPGNNIKYDEPKEWLGFRCIGRRGPYTIQYSERTHAPLTGSWVCTKILDSQLRESKGKYGKSGEYIRFEFRNNKLNVTDSPIDKIAIVYDVSIKMQDSAIHIPLLYHPTIKGMESDYRIRQLSRNYLILQTTNKDDQEINYIFTRQFDNTKKPVYIDCGAIFITHVKSEIDDKLFHKVYGYIIKTNTQLLYQTPVFHDENYATFGYYVSENFQFPGSFPSDSLSSELIIEFTVSDHGAGNFNIIRGCNPEIEKSLLTIFEKSKNNWKKASITNWSDPIKIRLHFYFYYGDLYNEDGSFTNFYLTE